MVKNMTKNWSFAFMNSDTEWSINAFSIILSRIIQKWILLIEVFLSLGTSRDYAQISKGKGGT